MANTDHVLLQAGDSVQLQTGSDVLLLQTSVPAGGGGASATATMLTLHHWSVPAPRRGR